MQSYRDVLQRKCNLKNNEMVKGNSKKSRGCRSKVKQTWHL